MNQCNFHKLLFKTSVFSMSLLPVVLQAMTRVNPTVYNSIASLSSEPNTTVVVFSGSDKAKLDETFGDLNVWLAAENGIFMRPPPDEDGEQEVSNSSVFLFLFSAFHSKDLDL